MLTDTRMSQSLKSARVLIVENDENNILITQRLLQLAGVQQMFSFYSVAEALALLPAPVDLVLLDMELDDEDGAALVPRFRADGRFSGAAIVALTANILPHDVQRARDAGFDSFLGKPLNFERFPQQLQQILDGEPVWQTR